MNISMKAFSACAVLSTSLLLAQPAAAGPATEALATCITGHASPADHLTLMKWIFASMARHPSVASMTNITDAQHVEISRSAGTLFNRLLTQDCAFETGGAYKEDGDAAVGKAFETLGGTAMGDIMTQKDVQSSIGELNAYIDMDKLNAILTSQPAPAK